jgi:hypothetical protein
MKREKAKAPAKERVAVRKATAKNDRAMGAKN